jgi:L-alanine-DL-glutamate epimerase-like enolase superfamily enzyme
VRLNVERHKLRLVEPWRTAHGSTQERELLQVQLTGADGVSGYGEAAPLEAYDGVSTERAQRALESYKPTLERAGEPEPSGARLLEECRRADDLPQALAAIDMALWDRAGRRAGKPVAALIAEEPARAVAVNATITALDRATVAEQAARAAREGYECLKLKVGVGDDPGRVAAARAGAGPRMGLRLDANGAWTVEEAVRTIAALAPAGLELVEEPVHGIEAMREVRARTSVRVAIDETAGEPGALGAGVADAVCLKISRRGGIGPSLAAATLARQSGAEVYLASNLDGPLGIAAALHAAAALASRNPMPPCGLATLGLFAGFEDPLPVREGRIAVPSGAGLGVEPLGRANRMRS